MDHYTRLHSESESADHGHGRSGASPLGGIGARQSTHEIQCEYEYNPKNPVTGEYPASNPSLGIP
jgi:hypothetical protein